jgi:5-methylcytosine-specific restriction endonuclease McrA
MYFGTMNMMISNECLCGCGALITATSRWVKGHNWRGKTRVTWNKGISYTIAKRTVYANKGAWNKALIRLYGNRCMRCGWDEATVDAHHITPKSEGGEFRVENAILLCPNCHRLAHTRADVRETFAALKAAAVVIGARY